MIRKTATIAILLIALCLKVSASEVSENEVKAKIVKHSIELGIEPALALSLAKSESKFKHNLRSPYGAVGVFQLMPATAKRLGVNPYVVSENIRGGLMYYKMMYDMFGSVELALAAYNAGPTVVNRYKTVPPIGETKRFVRNIMTEYNNQKVNPDQAIINAFRAKPPKFDLHVQPIALTKPVVKATPNFSEKSRAIMLKPTIEIISLDKNMI